MTSDLKPQVVCMSFLVVPRDNADGDEPWDENRFHCAIEKAVDGFARRFVNCGLKVVATTNGGDDESAPYTDYEPGRRHPSVHGLLANPEVYGLQREAHALAYKSDPGSVKKRRSLLVEILEKT